MVCEFYCHNYYSVEPWLILNFSELSEWHAEWLCVRSDYSQIDLMGCAAAHLAPPQLACARDDQILTDMGTFLLIRVRLYCRQTQPDQAIDPSRFRVLKQNLLLFLAMYDSVALLTHPPRGGMRLYEFS